MHLYSKFLSYVQDNDNTKLSNKNSKDYVLLNTTKLCAHSMSWFNSISLIEKKKNFISMCDKVKLNVFINGHNNIETYI